MVQPTAVLSCEPADRRRLWACASKGISAVDARKYVHNSFPVGGRLDALAQLTTGLAGRYTVSRVLGSGGMATVYLAHDVRHGRDVAVKVLRSDIAYSIGSERFTREIRLAASLSPPHILPLFDSGDADGALFYVMPVVEGLSLRDRLHPGTNAGDR